MSNKPISMQLYCSKPLSARFWETFRCPMSGWVLIKNLSTSDGIRMHWESAGDDNSTYDTIEPQYSKPYQVDEGDDIWISSAVNGTRVRFEIARYKPVKEEYGFDDDCAIGNVPFSDDGVGATTTYDLTTLGKGYGTFFQVVADGGFGGGFQGSVEFSSDLGVTYSSPITITDTDTMKLSFSEERVITHIKVTRIAGSFSIYYR